MNVYTNNEFKGHYPVGSAAVVAADSQYEAAVFLSATLESIGLKQNIMPEHMILVDRSQINCVILNDGNY